MFKKITAFLVVLVLALSLVACADSPKQNEPPPSDSRTVDESKKPKQDEPEPTPSDTKPAPSETEKQLTPDPEPGIPAPEGWPEEIPTPVTGEIMGVGWAPDKSFCTTDIVYKQTDIDAYRKRLESYGFAKQTEHKYAKDWPDAEVYSNGRWDVIVADANDVFDYTYANFYPLFDVVADGYDGQPKGWPEEGGGAF